MLPPCHPDPIRNPGLRKLDPFQDDWMGSFRMMWGFGHSGVQKGRIAHRDGGSGPCGVQKGRIAHRDGVRGLAVCKRAGSHTGTGFRALRCAKRSNRTPGRGFGALRCASHGSGGAKSGRRGGRGCVRGYPASLGKGAAASILHRLGTAVQKTGIFEGLAYFMYSASFSSAASASFTPPFLALAK